MTSGAGTDSGMAMLFSLRTLAVERREERVVAHRAAVKECAARDVEASMAKKLVVCCDGTWNTPRTETNIYRTYRFLREGLGWPHEQRRLTGVLTCEGRAQDGS